MIDLSKTDKEGNTILHLILKSQLSLTNKEVFAKDIMAQVNTNAKQNTRKKTTR